MSFTIGGDFIPRDERNGNEKEKKEEKKSSGRPVKVRKMRRKNSWVTQILNLNLEAEELQELAAYLKKRCACGGTIRDSVIEIQGDKEGELKQLLRDRGIKAQ